MLGGQPETDNNRSFVNDNTHNTLARVNGCLGMHGVMWNREGMIRAYNHFTYWNRMTIDQSFAGLQKEDMSFYAPAKWIVEIDDEATQFGGDK